MFTYIKYLGAIFTIALLLASTFGCYRPKLALVSTPAKRPLYFKQPVWKLPPVESLPASLTVTYAPNGIMGSSRNHRPVRRHSSYKPPARTGKLLPASSLTTSTAATDNDPRNFVEPAPTRTAKSRTPHLKSTDRPATLPIKSIPPKTLAVNPFIIPRYALSPVDRILVASDWTLCLPTVNFSPTGALQAQTLVQGHYQLLAAYLQPGLSAPSVGLENRINAVTDRANRLPIVSANLPKAFQESTESLRQSTRKQTQIGALARSPQLTPTTSPALKKPIVAVITKPPMPCIDLLQRFIRINVCNSFGLTINDQNLLIGEGCHLGMTLLLIGYRVSRIIRQQNKLVLVDAEQKQNSLPLPVGYQNQGDSLLICREITVGKTTHKLLTIYRRLPAAIPPMKRKRWRLF